MKIWSTFLYTPLICIFSLNACAKLPSWQNHSSHSFRIISGTYQPTAKTIYGAFQFELKDGWITYWKNPGDAGLPLTITSYTSGKPYQIENLEIIWPTPKRFTYDHGLYSLGYKGKLLIPFKLQTADIHHSLETLTVNIDAYYGVCKEICIPYTLQETLEFVPGKINTAADNLIAQALDKMP